MTYDQRTHDFFTSCKDCYFAVWDDKQQIGCQVNRIQKYVDREIADKKDGNNFYTIQTFCNAHRTIEWAAKYDNPLEMIAEQTTTTIDFIVVSIDQELDTVQKILSSFKNCCEQKLKPNSIVVLVRNASITYRDLDKELSIMANLYDVPYKLTRILDPELSELSCYDLGVKQCKAVYFCMCIVGQEPLPKDLSYKLDYLINKEVVPISLLIYGDDQHGMICQRLLHKIYGGNINMPLQEKIKEASVYQNNEKMVKLWTNLE